MKNAVVFCCSFICLFMFGACQEKPQSADTNPSNVSSGNSANDDSPDGSGDFPDAIGEHEAKDEAAESIPMNRIHAKSIMLADDTGNSIDIQLDGDTGNPSFTFGVNTVWVNFRKKTSGEEYMYDPDDYISMERNIENGTDDFPNMYFSTNIRRNEKNGIVFVDSFTFSAFEAGDISLSRRVYLTTDDYNIEIVIGGSDKLVIAFIKEVPQYFRHDGSDLLVWKTWDTIESFGNDLLNGTHESKTVNNWFAQTEKILDGLRLATDND